MKTIRYKDKIYRQLRPVEIVRRGDFIHRIGVVFMARNRAQQSIGLRVRDSRYFERKPPTHIWYRETDPLIAAMIEAKQSEKIKRLRATRKRVSSAATK